jgi:nucleoside-diphosphate-sugar epimerase
MAKDDGRVVSNFIVQALQGKPLTVYGDGSQTRSFCYVSDLIEGLVKLFFAEKVYEPVNLGNPTPINMKELAEEVISLTGSTSKVEYLDLPKDDPKQREPDITRAKKLLNWSPEVSRSLGIDKTVAYFKKLIV